MPEAGPGPGSVAQRLAGRHVLLTGVTGFVGEALLHLLLTEVPDVRLTVLIRPKGSTRGVARATSLLQKPIFATAVESAGGVDAVLRDRITVLEGDLSDLPALPVDLDAVVHCAGDVSFDPPVDEGFRTNVVGTRDLLARIDQAETAGPEVRDIHYVHISTAYVAGRRRGSIPEGPVDHDVDLALEMTWGLGQRQAVEDRSRGVEILGKERAKAEKQHSRAGLLTAARATEAGRRQWVKDELVRIGTERARSLGWTDCYTFTKAMGERVVEAWATGTSAGTSAGTTDPAGRAHRVSIVRPSIIESALERPHPGWIEGFKMAEPLILAYGRGELPEFPSAPDTLVDIVPVDHVVSAIVAVLAHPPEAGAPAYFHVSSGHRNPLTFNVLYDAVRAHFDEHPFSFGDRGAARLPDWRFPGSQAVERLLVTSERALKVADYVIGHAPRSDRARDLARKLDQQGRRLEFLRRYLDLYLEYATAELRFSDDHTMSLLDALSETDRATFAFDTAVVDWHHYLKDVHCPAVTKPIRDLDELRALRKRPPLTQLRPLASAGASDERRIAAFFDMDGTLLSSNVIETYLWMRLRELDGGRRLAEIGRIATRVPGLVQAERRQRSDFLRAVYREYAGARLADLDAVADEHLADHVLARLSPDAVRRIRAHRDSGHLTVLITGAIRPLTRPLRPLFDHIEAADLAVDDRGVCTGNLTASPLVGESRAAWMRSFAAVHGVDMKASFAYADSHSDLPLLEAVGNPVAVRPDIALFRHARRGHWHIVDWASPESATRSLDPRGKQMILALEMFRSLPRTVAGKVVGARMPGLLSGYAAPLRLVTIDPPRVDRPGWARLRTRLSGICGSDLGALSGRTSLYFSAVVSLPFVPGHEVVAELVDDCDDLTAGTRVVVDPVLGCAARGVDPCEACRTGATNRCARITVGHLSPGLQTGFCRDTGGGWGQQLAAHRSQLHPVPEGYSDEQALLVEPVACAVHTALRAGVRPNDRVLVSGAGSVGLFATLALRHLTPAGEIVVVAKHAHQREIAYDFGATEVVEPGEVLRRVRRSTGAFQLKPDFSAPYLLGGVDVAVDAVGSKQSLETALHATRAGGRVVLSGMPSGADLSAAWFRELDVVGTYASAQWEPMSDGTARPAFEVALELVAHDAVGRLAKSVASYPLHRWREALDHAHGAGRLGTVKVAFDPRSSQ